MEPAMTSAIVAALAIVAVTVAVCLGHIDGEAYAAIVAGLAGVGAGAGAHATGVRHGATITHHAPHR